MFYNRCQTHGTRIKQIFLVLLSLHREEVLVLAGEDGSAERAERALGVRATPARVARAHSRRHVTCKHVNIRDYERTIQMKDLREAAAEYD